LAVSVATSMAQTTYSQNVVGYINVTVPANNQFQFIANQLQTVTGNGTNNIQDVFGTSALISDPNGITNTVLYLWNGAGYTTYQYWSAVDSGGSAGWYDLVGNYPTTVSFNQGSASFIANPSTSSSLVTFTGNVVQGTNVLTINPGYNALSIIEPVSTNIDSALGGFVGASDPNGVLNDAYYAFNNGWTELQYWSAIDAGGPAGFYDLVGNYQSSNPAYFPQVGQGFLIQHFYNNTETWTNVFNVQ